MKSPVRSQQTKNLLFVHNKHTPNVRTIPGFGVGWVGGQLSIAALRKNTHNLPPIRLQNLAQCPIRPQHGPTAGMHTLGGQLSIAMLRAVAALPPAWTLRTRC